MSSIEEITNTHLPTLKKHYFTSKNWWSGLPPITKTIFKLLPVFIILAAIPLTVKLSQQQQNIKSHAASYTVPSTIDATGATDVTAVLNNWIATIPNDTTIVFPAGSTYLINQGIQLKDRQNLTLEGYGSKLKLSPNAGFGQLQSMIILGHNYNGYWGGLNTNITIKGFEFEASNPTPGVYNASRENQHAVEVEASNGVEIYDILVHGIGGDGVKIGSSSNIHIYNMHLRDSGRQGVSVISGSQINVENNQFDDVGYYVFDIEPNDETESATDIIFKNNTAGSWGPEVGVGAGFVACGSGTAYNQIGNITITGNTLTGSTDADLTSYFNQNQHKRLYNIIFTNNRAAQAKTGSVLEFKSIDGLTVSDNIQPLTSGSFASITDSTSVVNSGNITTNPPPTPTSISGSNPTLTSAVTPTSKPTATSTPTPTSSPVSLTITSGPTVSSITNNGATITWYLSYYGTGQIQYGTTSNYGLLSTAETSFNWNYHVQALSGLLSGTTYHYRVKSINKTGVTVYSADKTFTTTGVVITPTNSPTPTLKPIYTPTRTSKPSQTKRCLKFLHWKWCF